MKNILNSFYEKHPRLFSLIVFFLVVGIFRAGKFYLSDQYDESRFSQLRFDKNMPDTGEYIEESVFSRPYQREDYYGSHLVLDVMPGTAKEARGVYWYPAAEYRESNLKYLLYSEEPLSEETQKKYMTADCLITGYYSVPTGQAIRVASGGFVLEILTLREAERENELHTEYETEAVMPAAP